MILRQVLEIINTFEWPRFVTVGVIDCGEI